MKTKYGDQLNEFGMSIGGISRTIPIAQTESKTPTWPCPFCIHVLKVHPRNCIATKRTEDAWEQVPAGEAMAQVLAQAKRQPG